jgi:putative membrane protein
MMMVSMVIFWGIIIGAIVLLVRYIFPQSGLKASEDALEILKRRYARGEIEKDEFVAKRRELLS